MTMHRRGARPHQFIASLTCLAALCPDFAAAQVMYPPIRLTLTGAVDSQFGHSVRGAGDVNDDGFDDVIVGAYLDAAGGSRAGSARVYSGATGAVLHTFLGLRDNELGRVVSGVGDVNRDGFDDVIVSAGGPPGPRVIVYSGATGAPIHTIGVTSEFSSFGASVSAAGDFDGDDTPDFAVSDSSLNTVQVFSGATAAPIRTIVGNSTAFGASIDATSDIDLDGVNDLIISGRNAGPTGSAFVYSGATGALLRTFVGDGPLGAFGHRVAAAGDVNADGVPDVVVGAPDAGTSDVRPGSARVFSGATGATLYTFNGVRSGDRFGSDVSPAGDYNGDGYDDVFVAAFAGLPSAYVRVFSGRTGTVLLNVNGDIDAINLGRSLRLAGDLNGDGVPDLIAGASSPIGVAYVLISSKGGWPVKPAAPAPCTGDADGNRAVNFLDITTVLSNFGAACP